MVALLGVAGAGDVLSFAIRSSQAQNAIQITIGAALAAIIVLRLRRASDVIDAALRLAEQIARFSSLPDPASKPNSQEAESTAAVLPLQRAPSGAPYRSN